MRTEEEASPPEEPFFYFRMLRPRSHPARWPLFIEVWTRPRPRSVETFFEVLRALGEGGKPWSELEALLGKKMSTATLSRRLKDGMRHGLIVKTLGPDGRVIYELTAKGRMVLEMAELEDWA